MGARSSRGLGVTGSPWREGCKEGLPVGLPASRLPCLQPRDGAYALTTEQLARGSWQHSSVPIPLDRGPLGPPLGGGQALEPRTLWDRTGPRRPGRWDASLPWSDGNLTCLAAYLCLRRLAAPGRSGWARESKWVPARVWSCSSDIGEACGLHTWGEEVLGPWCSSVSSRHPESARVLR